ncbi:MAG: TM2 domain-containing protein [Planctomycetia bacterium]|nr:TM2 domain-containing protein [Planctomycetia bacterium]
MPSSQQPSEVVELKNPIVAAILAWLIPGLGHIYQGRTVKGLLFMICILGTFFYGLLISDGRAVYASWQENDKRLPYLCQLGAGLPALPALVQTYLVREGKPPLFAGVMAPPATPAELNEWYKTLHRYFELGTVYTMIAGLLNILAIYDAWGGPVQFEAEEEKRNKEQMTSAAG